jgi:hypothetical protein
MRAGPKRYDTAHMARPPRAYLLALAVLWAHSAAPAAPATTPPYRLSAVEEERAGAYSITASPWSRETHTEIYHDLLGQGETFCQQQGRALKIVSYVIKQVSRPDASTLTRNVSQPNETRATLNFQCLEAAAKGQP